MVINSPSLGQALKKESESAKSKWSIQNLYFAHLALTDESEEEVRISREDQPRKSGRSRVLLRMRTEEKPFRVWIEDWSVEGKGPAMRNQLLKAGNQDLGIELLLTPEKKPVVHGQNGISQKAEGEGYASHYYSITRLKTEGKIFLKKTEIPVHGMSLDGS